MWHAILRLSMARLTNQAKRKGTGGISMMCKLYLLSYPLSDLVVKKSQLQRLPVTSACVSIPNFVINSASTKLLWENLQPQFT